VNDGRFLEIFWKGVCVGSDVGVSFRTSGKYTESGMVWLTRMDFFKDQGCFGKAGGSLRDRSRMGVGVRVKLVWRRGI